MPQTTTQPKNKISHNWHTLLDLTVLSAYFYVLMEWLFFVTKPSSLSVLSPFESAKVLFVTAGTIALILLVSLLILSFPALAVKHPKWHTLLLNLSLVPPALILAITALILIDNFTYTVFKFGVISTTGIFRGLYALGFLIIFWRTMVFAKRNVRKRRRFVSYLTIGLLAVSAAGIISIQISNVSNKNNVDPASTATKHPNILILGSDGLSASFLSAYGYSLDTTPFLTELTKTSLVAENAFPNASSTTASTTTALTGREPAVVKVYRYPDILSGADSFEHLPGILKRQGYKTVEIGTPYYVDAQRLNLLDGFDVVNNQSLNLPAFEVLRVVLGNSPSMYFLQTIGERVTERLLHIFYVRAMQNPLVEVNDPKARVTDDQRVSQILDLLDNSDRPVFIFVHMMDTHGPLFSSDKQVFASGSDSSSEVEWDKNRYEDAILTFDNNVKKIYEHLSQNAELDNTVILIYTDHGFKYVVNQRIPIIIHFPNDAYAGKRENNVQIMDIPVTILDYLGIPKPDWMTGISMLGPEPSATREIISITAGSPKKIVAPFYQIKTVQVIVCQKWYALNVQENKWTTGNILGHTTQCDKDLLPPDDDIHQKILEYLDNHGYDISSLQ